MLFWDNDTQKHYSLARTVINECGRETWRDTIKTLRYYQTDFSNIVEEDNCDAFKAYLKALSNDLDFALDTFKEAYEGEHDHETAFAEYLIDVVEIIEVPENMRFYFDYEKFARDLFINDYMFIRTTDTYQGYVFRRM